VFVLVLNGVFEMGAASTELGAQTGRLQGLLPARVPGGECKRLLLRALLHTVLCMRAC
jgi:hypothetical protein